MNKKKEGPLTEKEHAQLDTLRREADTLMFRKAYAAVLLKHRGFHPPSIHELPKVS